MGGKLVAGGRPTSAANDVVASAPSDSVTAEETEVSSTEHADRLSEMVEEPSTGTHSAFVDDEAAAYDEPLDPSPRISEAQMTGIHSAFEEDESAALDEPLDPSPRIPEAPSTGTHSDFVEETTALDEPLDTSPHILEAPSTFDEDETTAVDEPWEPSARIPEAQTTGTHSAFVEEIPVGDAPFVEEPAAFDEPLDPSPRTPEAPSAGTHSAFVEETPVGDASFVAETAALDEPLDPSPRTPEAPSTGTHSEDEMTALEEPVDTSPRIPALATHASLAQVDSITLRPIPIEVWTEESAADSPGSRSDDDQDDKEEPCVEDEALDPLPRPDVDPCEFDPLDKGMSDSKLDPSSSGSEHSGYDDRAERCVEDEPLEPHSQFTVDVHGSGKLEERTSAVDEDRDIDTTETSKLDVQVDMLSGMSKWSGLENLDADDSPSSLLNGFPHDDVRV